MASLSAVIDNGNGLRWTIDGGWPAVNDAWVMDENLSPSADGFGYLSFL